MIKGTSSSTAGIIDPQERVKSLVDQVNEGHGKALIEQLVHRLDLTARDFTAEIDELVERLKRNAATQEELRIRIRQQDPDRALEVQQVPETSDDEVTEWEIRLARLEESAD
ncbi:MAG: hypothetical protein V3W14_07415 [Candidatus Neomarinimicrobiota bacterium]